MRGRKLQYLVQWRRYELGENFWLLEGDLEAPNLIADCHGAHPTAPKCINALVF
jgi:hypothetical protein